MNKRLYRSSSNKMLAGVCGGFAEYFNIDPTIVRVGWAILAACAAVGVVAYIICAVIMPEDIVDAN